MRIWYVKGEALARSLGAIALVIAFTFGCGPIPGQLKPGEDGSAYVQQGEASYYGDALHGNTTASGERFDMNAFTAAHRTLPFGTIVRVTRMDTGRYVVVRINDRGPYAEGRIIDLSKAAARSLDMLRIGVTDVVIEVLARE